MPRPGFGRGQGQRLSVGGGNPWRGNKNNSNQNKPPQPLMQTQMSSGSHFPNHTQNQINSQQQLRLQQQQQQQSLLIQQQQQFAQARNVGGDNTLYGSSNAVFNQGQDNMPAVQMLSFQQQQQQQHALGSVPSQTSLMNHQFQQTQQNFQQNFPQTQMQNMHTVGIPQQQQLQFTHQQHALAQQQLSLQAQAQVFAQQKQQQLLAQAQVFAQQNQQHLIAQSLTATQTRQQFLPEQQQQVFNQQWQWTPADPLKNVPPVASYDNTKINPPLPPTPAPPPPPVSITEAPLPPPEKPSSMKYDAGRIFSTNLSGLMDIISVKNNKIPGLDLEPVPKDSNPDIMAVLDVKLEENSEADKALSSSTQLQVDSKNENHAAIVELSVATDASASKGPLGNDGLGNHTPMTGSSAAPQLPPEETGNMNTLSVLASIENVSKPPQAGESADSIDKLNTPTNTTRGALLAFDKKFREWEKQFEDWKRSSIGHPDKDAYNKYLAQWEAWREQLIQQRRFIIENINKDRGNDFVSSSDTTSTPVLKDWEADTPSTMTPTGISTNSFNQFHQPQQQQAQTSQPEPIPKIDHHRQSTQPQPLVTAPALKDPYATRDLSKLILNPFAVTGGPITFEQRQFIQSQPLQAIPMRPPVSNVMLPHSGNPPGGHTQFDNEPKPSSAPKLSSFTPKHTSLRGNGRPQSPVERVSRQPEMSNVAMDFSDDINRYDPNFGNENITGENRLNRSQPNPSQNSRSFGSEKGLGLGQPGQTRYGNPSQLKDPNPSEYRGHTVISPSPRTSFEQNFPRDDFSYSERRPPPEQFGHDFNFFRRERDDIVKPAETENVSGPVTFDYGHGSNPVPEESIFSRNRSTNFSISTTAQLSTSVAEESDGPVTFDYGHGTTAPIPVCSEPISNAVDDEEENYHDRYQDPQEDMLEENYYHGPLPPVSFYPDPDFHEFGFRGPPRPMLRGRGMAPIIRGYPHQQGPTFRHPYPMYYDEFGYGPPGPRYRPPFRGPGPRFYGHPAEEYFPPAPDPDFASQPIRPPLFPITEFERPVRLAPPSHVDDGMPERSGVRQAPPRDLEPISPENSPKPRSDSRDREHSKSRGKPRESSRDRGRSSERSHRYPERSTREKELSPYSSSRRKRERSPRPRSRDRRDRSRSRSAEGYRGNSPGRRNTGGRRSSPPNSSSRPVLIEDILNLPGRTKRPSRIVIILRGLPGSGKTHVAKLIKDRETESGYSAPRILSLDDYFMTGEEKKSVKDPVTGKQTKESVSIYEYDVALETGYRNDLFKTFRKTIEAGYFHFIIVDCVNDKFKHFQEMTNFAKAKRFQVYVVEIEGKAEECAKRNIHSRTLTEIKDIEKNWERTPSQFTKLDVRNLLQDSAIQNVDMEDVSDSELDGEQVTEVVEVEDTANQLMRAAKNKMVQAVSMKTYSSALVELEGLNVNLGNNPRVVQTYELLHQWRERLAAIRHDIPGQIVSTSTLVEMACLPQPVTEGILRKLNLLSVDLLKTQLKTLLMILNDKGVDLFHRINKCFCHNCLCQGHVASQCPFPKNKNRQKAYAELHPEYKTTQNRRRLENRKKKRRGNK